MTVGELIKVLSDYPFDLPVLVTGEYQGEGGCETCGYGGTEIFERTIDDVIDLESKLHIVVGRSWP